MFKSHLEMIGRNETPSKKAKFWQSYVRSLKGSEDIRAHETPRSRPWRPYSAYADLPSPFKSIFDEPATASERISSTGYRYLPVHRETYGYSPRPIYDHHYSRAIPAANYDVEKAWNEHLKRMAEIERRYPSRYGLYLKDKPSASLAPLEYEPDNKPSFAESARAPSIYPRASSVFPRASSVFPRGSSVPREASVGPYGLRATSVPPFSLNDLARESSLEPLMPRHLRASSVEPVDRALYRLPIYHPRNRFRNLFNPSPFLPYSAISRDPFWWDMEDLKPFRSHLPPHWRLPSVLRDSYLSPVKRNYLWFSHPLRPFAHNTY